MPTVSVRIWTRIAVYIVIHDTVGINKKKKNLKYRSSQKPLKRSEIQACLKDRLTDTKKKSVLTWAFTASTGRTIFHSAASKVARLFAKSRGFATGRVCRQQAATV